EDVEPESPPAATAKAPSVAAPARAPAPTPAAKPALPKREVPEAAAGRFEVREPVEPVAASLELLAAGDEPRRAITVAAKRGDRVVLRIGLAMDVAMKIGTSEVPKTTLPRVEVDLAAEVVKVADDGIEIDLRVADVRTTETEGTSERVRAAVQQTVAGLRASTGTLVLSPDGRVQSIVMSAGGDAIESRAAGLDHALVELLPAWPREPVGIGARWRIVQPVVRGGVTLQRTSELELVARTDDAIEVAIESTHVAARGGDAAAGATKIEAQSGEGHGRIVASPHEVLPRSGEMATRTTTRASFAAAAEGVWVEIDLASSLARADMRRP
ncbi:MAG TPA: hypothetical protein VFG69_10955, partial [Nannocystaceae bacterium]|nr:hypothetical protein [Nannocystaceae bacterium]